MDQIKQTYRGVAILYVASKNTWLVEDPEKGMSAERDSLSAACIYIDNKLDKATKKGPSPRVVCYVELGYNGDFSPATITSVVENSSLYSRGVDKTVWISFEEKGRYPTSPMKKARKQVFIDNLIADTSENRKIIKVLKVLSKERKALWIKTDKMVGTLKRVDFKEIYKSFGIEEEEKS